MRTTLALVLMVCLAGRAAAVELGNRAPTKSSEHVLQRPAYDGREGGETIETATPIPALPFTDTGATCDNIDDYDAVCPYTGSTSPDVVYSYVAPADMLISFDLCGSEYDTKIYALDAGLNVIACNDDYYTGPPCGLYVSKLDVAVSAGETIYIVVDGYGGDCGYYIISNATPPPPCAECPAGGVLEGEPELTDGYVDAYNGGCNSPDYGSPFQVLEASEPGGYLTFCGLSGWYDDSLRDTDWFTAVIGAGAGGDLECTLDADQPTYLFELAPHDCATTEVVQLAEASCYEPAGFTVSGVPGDLVWLWVGPVSFTPPYGFVGHEYDYVLTLDGLAGPVATECQTWSSVKALYLER